jgi:hypothetical protein
MKKVAFVAIAIALIGAAAILATNYFTLQRPMDSIIIADTRDVGISISVHYEDYILPNSLVFDIREVPMDKAAVDVTRLLLQYAGTLKDKSFDSVSLEYRGIPKFRLKGDYFRTLGLEFGTQNPVYTMRTLPENVLTPVGLPAFGTWTGGWIGVMGKQMEDLNEFHRQWWMNDLIDQQKR